jgi:hypothetical protein
MIILARDEYLKLGYKEYTVQGKIILAKKLMPGGGFYTIILPNGSPMRHLSKNFEEIATLVEETNG